MLRVSSVSQPPTQQPNTAHKVEHHSPSLLLRAMGNQTVLEVEHRSPNVLLGYSSLRNSGSDSKVSSNFSGQGLMQRSSARLEQTRVQKSTRHQTPGQNKITVNSPQNYGVCN